MPSLRRKRVHRRKTRGQRGGNRQTLIDDINQVQQELSLADSSIQASQEHAVPVEDMYNVIGSLNKYLSSEENYLREEQQKEADAKIARDNFYTNTATGIAKALTPGEKVNAALQYVTPGQRVNKALEYVTPGERVKALEMAAKDKYRRGSNYLGAQADALAEYSGRKYGDVVNKFNETKMQYYDAQSLKTFQSAINSLREPIKNGINISANAQGTDTNINTSSGKILAKTNSEILKIMKGVIGTSYFRNKEYITNNDPNVSDDAKNKISAAIQLLTSYIEQYKLIFSAGTIYTTYPAFYKSENPLPVFDVIKDATFTIMNIAITGSEANIMRGGRKTMKRRVKHGKGKRKNTRRR